MSVGIVIIKQNPDRIYNENCDSYCALKICDYYGHVSMSYSELSFQISIQKNTNIY